MIATSLTSKGVTVLVRPRIEPEHDGGGRLVLLRNGHGWLVGDCRQALAEFAPLERIEWVGR